MRYNCEQLEKIYGEFKIKDGSDYWKMVVIDKLLCNNFENRNFKISEETLENIVCDLMENDNLWDIIDNTVVETIESWGA